MIARAPGPLLRPFVKTLWASQDASTQSYVERVLPTGLFHVVLRLSGPSVRLFSTLADREGEDLGFSLVGGARDVFHLREVNGGSSSVGAQLWPGAADAFFGVPANLLCGRHTPLDQLWHPEDVARLRERLLAARGPGERLLIFEQALEQRVRSSGCIDPLVQFALDSFCRRVTVDAVVRQAAMSHRHFIRLFAKAAGLTPKLYCRVLRFQNAVHLLSDARQRTLPEIAAHAGYSDQSHFSREFIGFSGISPGRYRQLELRAPNHVPV